jgi:hypothetical protein
MSDSRKAISEDEDDYILLCKKHGEPNRGGVYSRHNEWLKELDRGNTNLTFEEYDFVIRRRVASTRLSDIDLKIEELKKEKQDLENFLMFRVKSN